MSVFSLQLDRCLYSIYKLTCTDSQWDLLLLWVPSNIHMARKVDTFLLGLCNTACGNYVLQPGIEPGDMAVKALSSNHWTTRELLSSVQFSHSVVSESLRPHGLQHAKPPCPSPTLGVHSNSRPSSRWCHPAISSSVVPFSSCPQSLPASGSFQMSQLFTSGG